MWVCLCFVCMVVCPLQALMSLFVLASKDGWVNIMYHGLDAVGIDQQVKHTHTADMQYTALVQYMLTHRKCSTLCLQSIHPFYAAYLGPVCNASNHLARPREPQALSSQMG